MKIKLTQGKFAIVGPRDYAYLSQFKWYYHQGYAARSIPTAKGRRLIQMHRVILERMGCTNFKDSDHINRDGLDNRRCNLRSATRSQNQSNSTKYRTNTSGFKGVYWHKQTKKWKAQIAVNRRRIYLGLFEDKKDAAEAYNKAAKKYHKEFAKVNEIET